MVHLDIERIEESFAGISPRLDELTMMFYTDLFTAHPELKPLFQTVDLLRQRRKLAAMLTLVVTNLRRMDVLASALRSLGARHVAYGATEENYEWTEVSLLRSLERVAGDAWNEEVARAWTGAISLVTAEMRSGVPVREAPNARARPDESEDLDLLMEIASNPSLSFQRNSLFSSYVDKKKTDHEMNLARTVQQSLVPSGFPIVPGYQFSASYEPATHVGGDYYDWITSRDGHVCFIVGDVVGKGIAGALIMCRLAGAARALLTVEHDPARALTEINEHMCDRMPDGRFVTLALLDLDLATNHLTLASAGHLPPVHRKADGSATYMPNTAAGVPVGIDNAAAYQSVRDHLDPGDTIVLYTDGISEAMDPDAEMYGLERLRASVAAASEPARVGPAMLEDVRRFARGRPQSDDLTILAITRDLAGAAPNGPHPT
ncbi:MAG: PP2C family protein-serine/threonine phosphatase [Planctomycetota bacterium]|jgi:serine phosphatase RsbU (regulator of sigma subunit)